MSEFGNSSNMVNYLKYPQTFKKCNVPKPIKYIQNNHRIVIRSEDRDRSIYPNPCEYHIELPCRFRNISLFEIGSIMIPNFSNTEKYFIIQVNEIKDGVYTSSNKDICDAIALVPNSLGLNNYNYIYEKPGDTSFVKNFIKKFVDCPLASLSTITLKILKPDGNIMNFGNDIIPWDKEYFFSSNENSEHQTKLRLKFNNIGHDLKQDDDLHKDKIIIYNAKVVYINKNNEKITKSFTQLNGEYDYSNSKTNKVIYSKENENEELILVNDSIKVTVENNKIKSIFELVTENDTNSVITISGNWKRAYNDNEYYSRIKITTITSGNDLLEINTKSNHNLNVYDRIYVDKNINDPQTEWIKNYHVVVKIEKNEPKKFYINKNNITDHTLSAIAIADNYYTQNQSFLNNDDELQVVNLDQNLPNTNNDNFFLQRYGDPDPSIQNMFIFNIGCREEDNDNVMSQNISYGNNNW